MNLQRLERLFCDSLILLKSALTSLVELMKETFDLLVVLLEHVNSCHPLPPFESRAR